jgi:hypothetical protein
MTSRAVFDVIVTTELDDWAYMSALRKGGEHEWEDRLSVQAACARYPQTMRDLAQQITNLLEKR